MILDVHPAPSWDLHESGIEYALTSDRSAVYHTMNGPSEFHVIGTLKKWTIVDRLGRIRVPTLVTSGRYDEATPAIAETAHIEESERLSSSRRTVLIPRGEAAVAPRWHWGRPSSTRWQAKPAEGRLLFDIGESRQPIADVPQLIFPGRSGSSSSWNALAREDRDAILPRALSRNSNRKE